MPETIIRDLGAEVETELRARAARNGRSLDEEARAILEAALHAPPAPGNLAEAIARRFDPLGGVEIEGFLGGSLREPPSFDDWPDDEP